MAPPAGDPPRWASGAPSRLASLLVLAVLVPLGLGTKWYTGPGHVWVHDYAGDLCYAAFWFFALKLVAPGVPAGHAATGVLLICTTVEFSQLIHGPRLDGFRRTLPGRLLLGSDFEWADIAYYALGTALAAGLSIVMAGRSESRAGQGP